jgi:hypothetical protein
MYEEPRAHELRERYLRTFGGAEMPVPVESIAEDLLGLRVEESWQLDCSGMLVPAERRILLNAAEAEHDGTPIRRHRFTIAHELGHWICHCLGVANPKPTYCRPVDVSAAADRTIEREANVFAAELLMPEEAVLAAWGEETGLETCAARFDVSRTAMHWRLYSFDMISDPPT